MRTQDPNRVILTWQYWHDMVDYAEACAIKYPDPYAGTSYAGTKFNNPEAWKLARTGWPEKVEALTRAKASIMRDIAVHLPTYDVIQDVIGQAYDLGMLVSGVPECGFHWAQTEPQVPLKIVFSPEAHVGSGFDALVTRGAIIWSLIDALEQSGRMVELWLGFDTTSGGKHYESRVLLKAAGHFLAPALMTFPLCHPDYLATLEFACIRHEWTTGYVRQGSYGFNSGITLEGDIRIDGSWQTGHHWRTPETMKAWLLTELEKAGVRLH